MCKKETVRLYAKESSPASFKYSEDNKIINYHRKIEEIVFNEELFEEELIFDVK